MASIRRAFALFVLLALAACSTSEDLTAPTLEAQFGTAYNDTGLEVAVAPDGSVYTLAVEDADGDYYGVRLLLTRYTQDGGWVWSRNAYDYASECYMDPESRGLSVDAKGFIYVSFVHASCEEEYHSLLKYNSAGAVLRNTLLNYGVWDADAAVDAGGNLYFTDNPNGILYKSLYDGSFLWERRTNVGTILDVKTAANGYVYVSGTAGVSRYSSSGALTWTKPGAANDIATSGTGVYLRSVNAIRKLDASGRQLWGQTPSGLSGLVVGDLAADAIGNVYLTGKYGPSSNRNVFTRKLSSGGSAVFTKTFGTPAYDDARGVATATGSSIYITGATQGSLAHPNMGDNDGYVRKLSSSGNAVWTR